MTTENITPESTPESKKYRVQLELVFDAVETDEAFEIGSATAKMEGSPELTMMMGIEMIHDSLGTIAAQALLAGTLSAHLADDDTEGVSTVTILKDGSSERTTETNQD
ncbi:hypothetical protein FGG65_gp40 [Corynebacterium phage phi673]|uniref:Uncharacterized protein n=1 Tax=Corynebacterium phage phi673 TaxID=2052821 RepID=A0A2H4PIU1_9CAUD|nr:hypothetical protein FGG65_gp40 [Corynebacterium phage phi673]ATW62902.1 hypothetical protein phi673_gp40 [Corynebacterium phage phi673]